MDSRDGRVLLMGAGGQAEIGGVGFSEARLGAMSSQSGGEEPTPVTASFFPVAVDSLDTQELELDLYLLHEGQRPVLYRSVGSTYSMADCRKLAEQGIQHLYVPTGQHRVFQRVMTERLVRAYEDPELGRAERCRIVRESCGKMIEDLMSFPHVEGIAETIGTMAARFSAWCVEDPDKFGYLLDMSEHDFYTTTHMVNVGVGCGLLCAELLGGDESCMRDVMQGGLIHDVGKRGVPADILNKEGKLTDEEWVMIRNHPTMGAELISRQEGITPVAIEMTRDHHERMDGRGYPAGLKAAQIGRFARLCAVVDVYDAMTSARPYRGAIPPCKVLESMREEAGTVLDAEMFRAWESVVKRLIQRDPERCVKDAAGIEVPKLRMLIPSSPKQAGVRQDVRVDAGEPADRACDLAVVLEWSGGQVGGRVTAILSTGGLRLVLGGSAPATERVRLSIEGREPVAALIRHRRYGPAGEPMIECELVRARKAG